MQVVVVADKKSESIAGRLVHAISTAEEPLATDGTGAVPSRSWSAAFWTEAKYRDTGSSLLGNEVLVFIGPSQTATDLADVLPLRFSDLGATCFVQGSRAVILADVPDGFEGAELEELAGQLNVARQDSREPLVMLPNAGSLALRWQRWKLLRRQVVDAQYRYAISRFVADELPAMASER